MTVFNRYRLSILLLASALLGMGVLVAPAVEAAVIQVINGDGPGEGFNDPRPVTPVGGNTGTTLGQQRLIAFQHAANIWAGLVSSAVTIRVGANFDPLPCNATGAVLGAAGPTTVFRDFPGAPRPSTWYPGALASALSGRDLDAGHDDDIGATFNSAIGTTCAFPRVWYYGLDGNPPASQIDFVSVVVHELGHGLGFLTFIDVSSGAKFFGFNDTFMLNLEGHGASPSDFPSMTDAQRVAASTDTGNLHWVGTNVEAASGALTAGKVGNHVQMFAPNPEQEGSSVSHWDTALTPNQVMEPSYTGPHHDPVLELPLFQDIGWTILTTPPPPPPSANLLPGFPADYDGDGKTDIAVYRPSNGTWYIINSATSSVRAQQWGVGGDIPVPGKYDGDGKADITVYRPSTGTWFILQSSNGAVRTQQWGWSGDVPVPGDYDGDGKTDIAVYRPSTGTWIILRSSTSTEQQQQWGLGGDRPVPADYDGDGKTDIAVYRPSTGTWFILNSATSSIRAQQWGNAGDIPVPGDYDGDGKTDIAVYRPATGTWFILQSVNGSLRTVQWGWAGDIPVPGNYDGDGKTDIAVYRPSTGTWYVLRSSTSTVQQQQWGLGGDQPPPGWF